MLKLYHRQLGTTLVELLIGLVIMGILLAIGVPNLRNWVQSGQIRTAAEAIQDGLQLAANHAVTYNNPVQFALPGTDATWSVGCVTATAACPGFIQSHSGVEGAPNAIVAATQPTIAFNGLGRVSPPASAVFAITNPKGGTCAAVGGPMRCLNVQVSAGGDIRMCDPALTISNPTDPQAC